jgi:hypothetical protein
MNKAPIGQFIVGEPMGRDRMDILGLHPNYFDYLGSTFSSLILRYD